ncbi:aspartate aminotransferase [Tricladium varicosporioides]|nr:aspartate aminotransferase [Hymenoscyphus varicosporioides]
MGLTLNSTNSSPAQMLSKRGFKNVESQNTPWRFAPGANNKYDKKKNPDGVVVFGNAENELMRAELSEFIREKVKISPAAFTYAFSTAGGPRFPSAMASHLNDWFNPVTPVTPSQILTGAGLTAVHEMLALSIGDPGDGLLVSRPIYGRFELDFGNTAGFKIVYAEMKGTDPFEEDIVRRYDDAYEAAKKNGVNITALLIVNPNNPLGRCYPRETLKQIMRFCEEKQIHMISDEVYALSVYDTIEKDIPKFTSILSIDPAGLIDSQRLHVLYGMSKDFASAGLRIGCIITQNNLLRKAMFANVRFHNPSGMSIAIGTQILEDKDFVRNFITLSRKRISEQREYTTSILEKSGVGFAKGGNAGFFVYIDLSPWLSKETPAQGREREYALAQHLLDRGVGVHPCEEHFEKPGHFRLVYTMEREVLEVGLRRLVNALAELSQTR